MENIQSDKMRKAKEFLQPFQLPREKQESVSARLLKDMQLGLSGKTNSPPVKMLPAFVRLSRDGTEEGDFLSLDVGGTNLRIMLVQVRHGVATVKKEMEKPIPAERKRGKGEEFFDYIAEELGTFLDSNQLTEMPGLGFMFSFPCRQKALDKGILINWTKDFSCSGVEGKDVVQLLKDAIRRKRKYEITSVAMVNDTVATVMSCDKEDPLFEIAVIIGTGTNACYMEEMCNVKCVEGDEGRMCINTEWGGFGDDGSLRDIQTEFDLAVDCYSGNPGKYTFEKMIGGMYLGEVARLVLMKMTTNKLLFNGNIPEALLQPYSFKTEFISDIESQDIGRVQNILGLPADCKEDCDIMQKVCEAISTRAAQLCGAALVAIAKQMGKPDFSTTTVAADGSVFKFHPQHLLEKTCKDLKHTFNFKEKAGAIGAAMVVAVENR